MGHSITDSTTIVAGYSDDNVELEGAISDEISAWHKVTTLTFDTGVRLRVSYEAPGVWRIENCGSVDAAIERSEDRPDVEDAYSDRAFVQSATECDVEQEPTERHRAAMARAFA